MEPDESRDGVQESIRLPAEAASAARARQFVRELLHDSPHHCLEDAALLCVTELVANVSQHTGSPDCTVTVRDSAEDVTIEVSDGAHDLPAMEPVPPYAEHGRGLHIIEALAGEWGVRRSSDHRKAVWARLCERTQTAPRP